MVRLQPFGAHGRCAAMLPDPSAQWESALPFPTNVLRLVSFRSFLFALARDFYGTNTPCGGARSDGPPFCSSSSSSKVCVLEVCV
jgi:hypothetical protein